MTVHLHGATIARMGSKKAKHRHQLVVALDRIAAAGKLTNEDLSARLGCDRSTVSRCRKFGRAPRNRLVLRRLELLVAKSEAAAPAGKAAR